MLFEVILYFRNWSFYTKYNISGREQSFLYQIPRKMYFIGNILVSNKMFWPFAEESVYGGSRNQIKQNLHGKKTKENVMSWKENKSLIKYGRNVSTCCHFYQLTVNDHCCQNIQLQNLNILTSNSISDLPSSLLHLDSTLFYYYQSKPPCC